MLAVSGGKLVAVSTPFGKRGWFYDEWTGAADWERVQITATQCPRITSDFLAEEKRSMGDRWYRQSSTVLSRASSMRCSVPKTSRLRCRVKPLFAAG
jgi:hypothetical protein